MKNMMVWLLALMAPAFLALGSCEDVEESQPVAVESVAFDFNKDGAADEIPEITLNVKETRDFNRYLLFTPANATNKNVKWYIDGDADIAVIDEYGVFTSGGREQADGKSVTIGVITMDGNKQAECEVGVEFDLIPVTSVIVEGEASLALAAGEEAELSASVLPADANNYRLEWASSNTDVVTVSAEGQAARIKACILSADGSTEITVKAVDKDSGDEYEGAEITVSVAKFVVSRNQSVSTYAQLKAAFEAIRDDADDSNDKEYTVTITENITTAETPYTYNGGYIGDSALAMSEDGFKGKMIILTDGGAGKTIEMTVQGALIGIGRRIEYTGSEEEAYTLRLKDSLTLKGNNNNNNSIIDIDKYGTLEQYDTTKITGNTVTSNTTGGVSVAAGGIFKMFGGEISENAATHRNGKPGVHVQGTFEMSGGVIYNNTHTFSYANKLSGGGVYVATTGLFTMTGGEIYSNTVNNTSDNASAGAQGAGVLIDVSGNNARSLGSRKTGGVIYGYDDDGKANILITNNVQQLAAANNSGIAVCTVNVSDIVNILNKTAYAANNLDWSKTGGEGGWE
jgi:hypothetical protein